jgi:hypothetical protein
MSSLQVATSCPAKCLVWSKQAISYSLNQGLRLHCFNQTDYGAECLSHLVLVGGAFPRKYINVAIHVHLASSCWNREIQSALFFFYLRYLNINECSWKSFQRSRNTEVCLPTGNACNAEERLIFINLLQTEWRMSSGWNLFYAFAYWHKSNCRTFIIHHVRLCACGEHSSGITFNAQRLMRLPAVTLGMLHLNS